MSIKSLRLRNICQHTELDWEFNPGLVGILGKNGSGKSNSMNAAYAALSGDFSRHTNGKAGYIKQGTTGPSYVELVCEHGGSAFTVRRSLSPDKKLLEVGGRSFTKVSEIEEKLHEILGCSPTLLDQYAFVAQWEMFSFLGTTAQRAKQFTELCGTEDAEECWSVVGARIGQDEAMARGVVDNSVELRQQIAEYTKLGKESAAVADAAKKLLLTEEQLRDLHDIKAVYAERQAELKTRAKLAPRIEELNVRVAELKAEDMQVYVSVEREAEKSLEGLRQHLLALRKEEQQAEIMENVRKVKNRLKKLVEPVKPPHMPGLQDEAELTRKITRLADENENIEYKLDNLDGNDVCPTCGTAMLNVAWQPDALKAQLEENEGRLELLRSNRKTTRDYDKGLRDYEKAKAIFDSASKTLQQQLAELPKYVHIDTTQLEANKAQVCGDINTVKKTIADNREEKLAVTAELNTAVGEVVALTKQVSAAGKRLKKLRKVRKADVESANALLDSHQEAKQDLDKAVAAQATYKKVADQSRLQLKKLAEHIAESKKADGWLDLLNRVRDVMHRNNLQAVAHQLALEDLISRVNKTLREFGGSFRVEAGEQLRLMCHQNDGTVIEAAGLSGGEKMTLALAYRLALSSVFAKTLGMMVLDEPTLALDEDNREKMAEVFQKLGGVARNRGCQIIVITHDELLCPAFDQVIRVGE